MGSGSKPGMESPAAPVYSPLIPLVTARKARSETSVESPAAPAFSPLTPLTTRKELQNKGTEVNFSPLPPMSPNALEMLETLCQVCSTVEHEYIDMSKRWHRNCVSYNDPKQDGDYDDDTDSDYVPDSGEEIDVSHSSVKQNKRKNFQVLESDSSDDETIQRGLISSHIAMVHDNRTRTDRTAEMLHNESLLIVSNDTTVDELISMCQGSDTEAVHPKAEIVRPVTENNDAMQTLACPKCGYKRRHPEYCLSEKKSRKYMNLPYHVKDKLVRPKVFHDYSCTCKQRCFLLVPKETRIRYTY